MSKAIEDTLKALTEFEAQLDSAKAEASEAKRQMLIKASDWAAAAKTSALQEAQRLAAEAVATARGEAEAEAESIRRGGKVSLKKFEDSLSKKKSKAAELVTKSLLGESQ